MQKNEKFEAAFSEFIDRKNYDTAQEALFRIVRQSFIAGWQAKEEIRRLASKRRNPPAGG